MLKRKPITQALLYPLIHCTLSACGTNLDNLGKESENSEPFDVEVASMFRWCDAAVANGYWCLAVANSSGEVIDDSIDFFEYQLGYRYSLKVHSKPSGTLFGGGEVRGSYLILEDILKQQEDPLGTIYTVAYNGYGISVQQVASENNDDFRLHTLEFTCSPELDCIGIPTKDGDSLELRFRYLGQQRIELIDWEYSTAGG